MGSMPLVAVVDDEASVRKALLRLLRLNRYQAEAFSSASEFLGHLSYRVPDCVVLDLHMPEMSGIELLREIRKRDNPPGIIVITAHDDQRTRDECQLLGTSHYLRKPLDSRVLLECIRNVVQD